MRAEPQKLVGSNQGGPWPPAEASLTGIPPRTTRLSLLNARAEDPSLWNNPKNAQKVMRQRQQLERSINAYRASGARSRRRRDADRARRGRGRRRLDRRRRSGMLKQLDDEAQRRSVEALLSGEADGNDTYLEVHAGAGGTESQDWASMLARMYMRWARAARLQGGDSLRRAPAKKRASNRSTFEIKGENAYGWLKTESGVHRLVRISPYDSNARRHTSFASVHGLPGGRRRHRHRDQRERVPHRHLSLVGRRRPARQHGRNSAVRITHMPSGIVIFAPAGALAASRTGPSPSSG